MAIVNSKINPLININYCYNGYNLQTLDGVIDSPAELINDQFLRAATMIEAHLLTWPQIKPGYIVLSDDQATVFNKHSEAFNFYEGLPNKVKGVYKILRIEENKIAIGGINLSGGLFGNFLDELKIKTKCFSFKVI